MVFAEAAEGPRETFLVHPMQDAHGAHRGGMMGECRLHYADAAGDEPGPLCQCAEHDALPDLCTVGKAELEARLRASDEDVTSLFNTKQHLESNIRESECQIERLAVNVANLQAQAAAMRKALEAAPSHDKMIRDSKKWDYHAWWWYNVRGTVLKDDAGRALLARVQALEDLKDAVKPIAAKYVVREGVLCVIVDGKHWTDAHMIGVIDALARLEKSRD